MASQQKLIILGGGESGTGAALLGQAKGFEVFLSDKSPLQEKYRNILVSHGIAFEEGSHNESLILSADLVVKSPGIPDKADLVQKLLGKSIPVISEIEFAGRYTNAKIIAITGSNGKTTTTLLTYHLLKSAGFSVGLAGNIGESFARQVLEKDFEYYVLELSSFQLDNMFDFKAGTAILLNITPDHLDRYAYDFSQYAGSKFRIIQNQTDDDVFIYNQDDAVIKNELEKHEEQAVRLQVSLKSVPAAGAYLAEDQLVFNTSYTTGPFSLPLSVLPVKGPHNYLNVMCAVLAALRSGVSPDAIYAGIQTFRNAPHRLEKIATVRGVDYVNDSKATNVDSVFYALQSFSTPIILILGGVDKGNDYDAIRDLVKTRVKGVIAMGKDNHKLEEYFPGLVPAFFSTDNLEDALKKAEEWGVDGDVVLLSPACASFDLFKNYEDRGDRFRTAVLTMAQAN
ncbi:UDP-N-acetylmuramoyl-L-alanine--D-glutamate ligase [Ravibacter arvi]|uniref:UDP-N-acetylmuramoylalanine--D-glutamate ligase n=1 Tax=Ravibacter arvi TaxID=2051041 RepID=A0ABP8LWR2_9BACT